MPRISTCARAPAGTSRRAGPCASDASSATRSASLARARCSCSAMKAQPRQQKSCCLPPIARLTIFRPASESPQWTQAMAPLAGASPGCWALRMTGAAGMEGRDRGRVAYTSGARRARLPASSSITRAGDCRRSSVCRPARSRQGRPVVWCQDRDAGAPCCARVPRRLPSAGASSFTSLHRAPRRLGRTSTGAGIPASDRPRPAAIAGQREEPQSGRRGHRLSTRCRPWRLSAAR